MIKIGPAGIILNTLKQCNNRESDFEPEFYDTALVLLSRVQTGANEGKEEQLSVPLIASTLFNVCRTKKLGQVLHIVRKAHDCLITNLTTFILFHHRKRKVWCESFCEILWMKLSEAHCEHSKH